MSRYKRMRTTPEYFTRFLKGNLDKQICVVDCLPDDVEIVDIYWVTVREQNSFWVLLRSKEFEDIPEDSNIPEIPAPTYRTIEEDKK